MDNYLSNENILDSMSAASSGPLPSAIDEQVERLINAFGANPKTAEDLRCAWTTLSSFLEQCGAFPARVEDIDKDSLAMYSAHFRPRGPDDNTLAALSMFLKLAGHSTSTLSTLVVNTRRVRLKNGANGRYQFERQRKSAVPSPQPGSAGDDESLTNE